MTATTTSPLTALLAQLSPHKKEKGDQFELLAKWWLETDPVYKAKFVWVEHFKDWEGRWTNKDLGTDLVAKDINGKIWSIQAKGYKLGAPITHKDMGTWLSDSHRDGVDYRLLITSTNAPGPHSNATTVFDGQTDKPVVIVDRTWLEESTVNWPVSLTELYAPQPLPKTPRPYQLTAIKDVLDGFEKTDRGQLLMVSGTGKTLTGLFINEQLESKNTLVLLPSLLLLKQTLKVYRANSTVDFKSLPVGSDATANNFGLNVLPTSLGFESTTDATTVAEFLREDGVKVVFSTYQSSGVIAEAHAMADVPDFDLVIADEAHNTAGALDSYFATVLHDEKIKATRRLFMTATPRNFTPRVLERAIEVGDERASMDDEKRYGTVFHELSYAQALKDKLVTDYRIAIIAVKEEELREWAESGHHVKINGVDDDFYKLAPQVAVLKAMRKYGMHRMITYHNRVDRARIFAATLPQALSWVPEDERPIGQLWAKHIHGDMSVDDRTLLVKRLGGLPDDGQLRVLSNAKVLTEGVDVPALDGIAILDPRRSAIDIYQAAGRAIRLDPNKAHPEKEIATIIIPVYVPAGEDVDDQAILAGSAFEPVWRELLAMRLLDERFAEWVDGFRLEKGKPGPSWKPTLPSVVETNLYEVFGEDFANAFAVKLIDMTTASFEEWFGVLEEFKQEFGHANPPLTIGRGGDVFLYHGYALGRWGNNLRQRKQTLSPDRIRRLDEIGFPWTPRDDRWEKMFSRYQANPSGKSDTWAKAQRIAKKDGKLASSRIQRLEAIGLSWDPLDDEFKKTVQRFVQYYKVYGRIPPPEYRDEDNYPLGQRTVTLRSSYKRGTLRSEWIDILNKTEGWTWDPDGDAVEATIQAIKEFVQQHGRLPKAGDDLDVAVRSLRSRGNKTRNGQKGGLRPEHVSMLEKEILGWSWDPYADRFEQNLQETKEFVKQHGRLPRRSEGKPGRWLGHLREKKGKLGAERRSRLDQEIPGWAA